MGNLILVIIVGYAIYTDNMGGARDAAGNYNKIMKGGEKNSSFLFLLFVPNLDKNLQVNIFSIIFTH